MKRAIVSQHIPYAMTSSRLMTSHGTDAVDKLRSALEEYRMKNYRQCLPSRFKKDIMSAAKQDESGKIAVDGLHQVFENIGYQDRISKQEIKLIFKENGEEGKIDVSKLIKII